VGHLVGPALADGVEGYACVYFRGPERQMSLNGSSATLCRGNRGWRNVLSAATLAKPQVVLRERTILLGKQHCAQQAMCSAATQPLLESRTCSFRRLHALMRGSGFRSVSCMYQNRPAPFLVPRCTSHMTGSESRIEDISTSMAAEAAHENAQRH
jgi:hypothetical protein